VNSKSPNIAAGPRRTSGAPALLAGGTRPFENIRRLKFNLDWITRPVFGVALAAAALGAIVWGSYPFACFVALGAIAGAREWHRMVGHPVFAREVFVSAAVIVAVVFSFLVLKGSLVPWLILLLGTAVAYASASLRGARAAWQAGGVLYLGVPALALVALRSVPLNGAYVIIGLMLAIWAADTGALIAGNLIGGAKLAPVLSPNKTWSGTLGGIATAAIVEAIYIAILHGSPLLGALYGAFVATIGHAGDLFESWVKRRFQFKDSGGLIPGHGGVLDRIDSTLAAASAVALAVFVSGFDPTFGAHL
jgi:phosphatidate cytidylyltransferase